MEDGGSPHEEEEEADEDASVPETFPLVLRYGLSQPYVRDQTYPYVDLDYGLRRGFLLYSSTGSTAPEDLRARTASSYVYSADAADRDEFALGDCLESIK